MLLLKDTMKSPLTLKLTIGISLLFLGHARAQRTWDGTTGNWNVAMNWSANMLPTSSTDVIINNSGTATLPLAYSGSYRTLSIGSASGGSGRVIVDAGGQLVGGDTYIGRAAGAQGIVTTSGTWTISDEFYVGYSGTGTLEINGGLVSTTFSNIGDRSTGHGTATVTSGTWNTTFIRVGSSGAGSLLINGGLVSIGSWGTIGYDSASHGSATVTSGTWAITEYLEVGTFGTGTLLINGGLVTSTDAVVGDGILGEGSVTVTTGAWNNTEDFSVGYQGTGSLLVNGGLVSSADARIGDQSTGVGEVSVTSGTLAITYGLSVGRSGTGSLLIVDGLVSSRDGSIGQGGGSHGNATVTSGTWAIANSLYVGQSGTGSLLVNGGLVAVSGTTHVGYNSSGSGTITINSGTFSTSQVMEVSGTGTLNLNGGVLQARANQDDFIAGFEPGDVTIGTDGVFIDTQAFSIGISTVLSGSGALTKRGAGTLTLSGSNSYSGGTIINSGTLVAGDNHAVGTGEVTVNAGTFLIQNDVSVTNQVTLAGGTLARNLGAGTNLANAINVTSDFAGGAANTTGTILAGTTSAATTISATFAATSLASIDEIRLSDVFNLTGIPLVDVGTGETDMFVLQLQVVEVTTDSFLGWLNPSTNQWENAVFGNIGGVASFQGEGAYDPSTDFVLGYYGVDTVNNSVWAVLNHNSDFSVVPEPSACALLFLGTLLLCRRRKQERHEKPTKPPAQERSRAYNALIRRNIS